MKKDEEKSAMISWGDIAQFVDLETKNDLNEQFSRRDWAK